MARTVQDVALMLQAIAGYDERSPIALDEPPALFAQSLERDISGARVAWSADLGGLPVDAAVIQTIEAQLPVFAELGMDVESAHPDFSGAYEVFQTLRAWNFEQTFSPLFAEFGEAPFKDTIRWNAAQGKALSGADISRAQVTRSEIFQRAREFLQEYECLLLPTAQVPPFDIDCEYPREIQGVVMDTYVDWMMSCAYITVTGLPAISVPCGFTDAGLPIGLQMVGRPRGEFALLQLAYAFQEATGYHKRKPDICLPAA